MIEVEYKIDLISSANRHGSVRDRMSRTKRHREAAAMWLLAKSREPGISMPKPPYAVTFTRISHREIHDSDNLAYSFKPTRDGVALFLGIDDAIRLPHRWYYAQELGSKKDLGIVLKDQCVVRIKIESLEDHQDEYPSYPTAKT